MKSTSGQVVNVLIEASGPDAVSWSWTVKKRSQVLGKARLVANLEFLEWSVLQECTDEGVNMT
jgi:hypothetical protein